MSRRHKAAAALAALAVLGATPALAKQADDGTSRGPSTTTDPYVIPVTGGVSTKSLFTVDDGSATNGYRMAGIPDGLGAFDADHGAFTLLMNHELPAAAGKVRRHGQTGAFVANLRIDGDSLEVVAGKDQINPTVRFWNYIAQEYQSTPSPAGPNPRKPGDAFEQQLAQFVRFCSSSLTPPGQLYNARSGRGYRGQLYFGNEENGNTGRTFGVTEDGEAQQLPRLGLASWENTKLADTGSDRTVTIGDEDGGDGQLWVHAGVKSRKADANAFDRAGLTNGDLSVIDAVDKTVTDDATWHAKYGKGKPGDVTLNSVDWDQSGKGQNDEAKQDGLSLNRIEDGEFDPSSPNDYFFVTTEGGDKSPDPADPAGTTRDGGGIWRLSFEDVAQPELGGTLTLLLDGSENPKLNKPDNITIDRRGHLLVQEDPGGNAHLARVIAYDIATGRRAVLARFDPAKFAQGSAGLITIDEESSGIISADRQIGKGWFLLDAQVHSPAANPENVEKGQLMAMKVDWKAIFGPGGGRSHGHQDD